MAVAREVLALDQEIASIRTAEAILRERRAKLERDRIEIVSRNLRGHHGRSGHKALVGQNRSDPNA